ncbi:DUF3604 domain-containing protein [Variovorax sp. GT1P44]|uniref:DUF3604 domain-containing protein n=1 Tax=Variovorax sp. GT1P44 TaxID=3443742 RepID=UPI003F459C73
MKKQFPVLSRAWAGAGALGVLCATAGAAPNALKEAYFGETHVHTSWSFDAYIFGNTVTEPADAYKYAQGQTIKHPMGYDVKITTPLDWMGVTDHSEYAGVVRLANTPGSSISKLPIAKELVVKDAADIQRIYLWLGTSMIKMDPVKELVDPAIAGTVWKSNNAAADAANRPGKFTAFCSYEWTSNPDFANMHRNVFFKDCAKVPEVPFSSLDSQAPEDLWVWMDAQRKSGNELLAISHNANVSGGLMYPTEVNFKGRPIDQAWAESRDRNERLIEIKQIKGASETHPLLSPNDEFASFEILNYLLGDPQGRFVTIPGSYARQALKDGISMQDTRGYNPYKMGFVGGSDSHNTAVPYRQENFFGGHAKIDGDIKARMAGHNFAGLDIRFENPAGLTGIWAEENTRESLFNGMQRKETFATSGPRMKLRFFGGWNYGADATAVKDWVKGGYAKGVPMGGDLPPPASKAPTFTVWAVKDPTASNLDRIQIVKGWSKNGQSFEQVYDVVWAGKRKVNPVTHQVPPIGTTVDIAKATYTNSIGSVELKGTWVDPEFDPGLHAFYYARVIAIPSPRWTTIQAKELGLPPPATVAAEIQERAWSSPIWYTPTAGDKKPSDGMSVAELTQKGATALDDAALKDLINTKFTWVRNNVTGGVVKMQWSAEGRLLIMNVDPRKPQPSEFGDLSRNSYLGNSTTDYSIKNGKIVTSFGNRTYETAVYKLGDRYLAARSNEFGYANYEIVPTPDNLGTDVKSAAAPR